MLAPTACLIIIGNEILSGRTQDRNLAFLAKELNAAGVRLGEVRVIPDIERVIVDTINYSRKLFTYVFTTGGIGPTHDDITAAAVAKAFGVAVERNAEAYAILEKHYGREKLNAPRLKMADIPRGGRLIANPVSAAPGFCIENVYVLAGVPLIMQAMFAGIKHELRGGAPVLSRPLSAYITEGAIAERLSDIQEGYPEVEIGSYPFMRDGRLGVCLVARATDAARLDACCADLRALLASHGDVIDGDLAAS